MAKKSSKKTKAAPHLSDSEVLSRALVKRAATKKAGEPPAVQPGRTGKPVRLDLTPADHDRLEQCARERGLTKSSYARQAVLNQIKADEREPR